MGKCVDCNRGPREICGVLSHTPDGCDAYYVPIRARDTGTERTNDCKGCMGEGSRMNEWPCVDCCDKDRFRDRDTGTFA